MSASFLIHRYEDTEELNPFLTVAVCEEDKLPPVKGKSPVVIKLRLLRIDWQHGKQLLVNALLVICLVCIGIIPLVSWPQQHDALQIARNDEEISIANAAHQDLSAFRQFQANDDERRHRGHVTSRSGLHPIHAADKIKGPRAWSSVEKARASEIVQSEKSDAAKSHPNDNDDDSTSNKFRDEPPAQHNGNSAASDPHQESSARQSARNP
ncbi:hypothetical protein H310_06703 [Aphanomyces invadans]|uniref:Uncharacterized protein n=1 Tax=Aphanomyces invadans TaxID=157072 RepID=A0A024U4C0_9STRA|nr:hypothetical protein H310_06703 [Aphanomyces invadans]ETW01080.1 hypothetical protein H310_06703 [Aphanomyces invadans]|eukprot:XP_008870078.1 hypothetical protein H310_06703 [Aphanomyces invadans]